MSSADVFSVFPGGQRKKGRKDPLIERVLIFVLIGHHTIDIPEISYVFTVFTVSEFANDKFRFFVRMKCYRHV